MDFFKGRTSKKYVTVNPTKSYPCRFSLFRTLTGLPADDPQVVYHPVYHIVEEPGGIRHLTECEVPTEEFNAARTADLAKRHPNLSPGLLEHLEALEPFLNTSIVAGFSYGVNKASMIVTKGALLGHLVGIV